MADAVRVYMHTSELGAPPDNLPVALRRALADTLTNEHINDDGRIEVLLVVMIGREANASPPAEEEAETSGEASATPATAPSAGDSTPTSGSTLLEAG